MTTETSKAATPLSYTEAWKICCQKRAKAERDSLAALSAAQYAYFAVEAAFLAGGDLTILQEAAIVHRDTLMAARAVRLAAFADADAEFNQALGVAAEWAAHAGRCREEKAMFGGQR